MFNFNTPERIFIAKLSSWLSNATSKCSGEMYAERVRFATEAAQILAKLDSEIERNVYLGEVSRMTGVEEEAIRSEIRKLMQKEDEAFQKEAEKQRQQNWKNYTAEGRKVEKGLIEAQRNLLYYASQHQGVHDTLKTILDKVNFE